MNASSNRAPKDASPRKRTDMQPKFKEDPREWRKQALLAEFGLAFITSLLWWRHKVSAEAAYSVYGVLGVAVLLALVRPGCFRGYYQFSMWLGFHLSQALGRVALMLFFFLVITPLGWCLRLAGKDALLLKRPKDAATYWRTTGEPSSLDRLF